MKEASPRHGQEAGARPDRLWRRAVSAHNRSHVPGDDIETAEDDTPSTRITLPWKVILYNDDIHAFDQVVRQVQKATGCSLMDAERITLEAHTRGKTVAFAGQFEMCFRVAGILREIQLIVEIEG